HFAPRIVARLSSQRKFSFKIPVLACGSPTCALLLYCFRNRRAKQCPSTNTSATIVNLNSKKSSSIVSRKSPAPTAPAKRPPSSFLSLVQRWPAAPPNPPPAPLAVAASAAAVAAAATDFREFPLSPLLRS